MQLLNTSCGATRNTRAKNMTGQPHSAVQNCYAAVEKEPVSMRRFYAFMPITQSLPQRNESCECRQKDGRRQHGRCPCEAYSHTGVHSSMTTRWPSNQCEASAEF